MKVLSQQACAEGTVLELGTPLSCRSKGGQTNSFKLSVPANKFVELVVTQRKIILNAVLRNSEGREIVSTNNPAGGDGPIHISEVAATSGEYRLEVRSVDDWAVPASFEVVVKQLRPAVPDDANRIAAEREFAKGLQHDQAGESALAIDEFNKALPYWKSVNDTHWLPLTHYALAQSFRKLRNLKKAEENFLEVLKSKLDEADWRIRAAALNDYGYSKSDEGESEKAISLLNDALALFRSHADRRGQASSLNNLAITYGQMGELRKALELTEEALPLREAENYQIGVNNLLNTIGQIHSGLGNVYEALESFEKALDSAQRLEKLHQLDSPERLGNALNSVALANDRIGNWQQANQYYTNALHTAEISTPLRVAILSNQAGLYASLADSDTATKLCDEAIVLLESINSPNPNLLASVLLQKGQLLAESGKLDEALKYFERARQTKLRKPKLIYVLIAIGDAYSRSSNAAEALKAYAEALKVVESIEDRRGQATAHQKLGEVYASLNNTTAALKEYDLALSLWRAVRDLPGEALSLNGMARLERERNNLAEALEKSNQAIKIMELLRTNVSSNRLRTSYLARYSDYYELNIDLNMLHSRSGAEANLSAALDVSERSRARTLLDMLADNRAELEQNVSAELRNAEREIEQKLRAKTEAQTALLSSRYKQSEAEAIAKEITDLLRQQDEIRGRIRVENPKYASLVQPAPLGAAEIQRQLDTDTLLLEYSLGEKRSYVWAVTNERINGFELAPRAEIESLATRLLHAITARNRSEANETSMQRSARWATGDKEYFEAAAALSNLVLQRVAPLLGRKRLVVVADGALQLVPFGLLLEPPTANSTESATLIAQREIVSLPSASVLALQRRQLEARQPAPLSVAVLADPVFSLNDKRVADAISAARKGIRNGKQHALVGASESQNTSALPKSQNSAVATALRSTGLDPESALRRLLMSRVEATEIARIVPASQSFMALGFRANRATVTSGQLSKYRYVHFATHGVVDLERPELSGIVLSMVDERGKEQDGYVRLYEIYNLNLPAELVVLSACQTGVGKQIKGEGLIALTRGFMYAGAARVVASLWKVDDSATAALMTQFYKEMFTNGKRPAAALRDAQMAISKQKQWQSPYYWAGFVLQGEWR
jgi:CHAT domain-containing protein/tetratricopeptide (TPR) repeat protein